MTIDVRDGVKGTRYPVRVRVKDPTTGEWAMIHGGTFDLLGMRGGPSGSCSASGTASASRPGGSKTLAKYLEGEWLPATVAWSKRQRPLAPTTADRYRRAVEKIDAAIGDVKLVDGRAVHAERLRAALLSSGLAPQTVGDTMKTLARALARAVAKDGIGTNWAAADVKDRLGAARTPDRLARSRVAVARGTEWEAPVAALALGAADRMNTVLEGSS